MFHATRHHSLDASVDACHRMMAKSFAAFGQVGIIRKEEVTFWL